jgi:hypothetical protein
MIKESVKLRGNLDIVVYDEQKQIKDERKVNNLVVAVGKNYIASRMESNAAVVMSHMAVGGGNVSPTTSDTTLSGEIDRVILDSTTRTNNTLVYVCTFPAGVATGTLAEAGIFNDATANLGTMLCRTNFNEVNKGAGDVVVITWNVVVE